MARLRVLITGPGGRIGRSVLGPLLARFDARTFDRQPIAQDPRGFVGELLDSPLLKKALAGQEVVLHLAATSDEAPFLDQLLPNNILAVHHLLEAAREARVRRVVFASSVQTMQPPPPGRLVSPLEQARPGTAYGATKVFGEALGWVYHLRHGLEFVALRLGWFQDYNSPSLRRSGGGRRIWLGPGDAVRLFCAAIERPGIGYAVVNGTSLCEQPWMSLQEAQTALGYQPQDALPPLDPDPAPPPSPPPATKAPSMGPVTK